MRVARSTVDRLIAAALVVAGEVEVWVTGTYHGPRALTATLALVRGGALLWRRRQPVAVLGVAVAAMAPVLAYDAAPVAHDSVSEVLPGLLALYAAGAYATGRALAASGCSRSPARCCGPTRTPARTRWASSAPSPSSAGCSAGRGWPARSSRGIGGEPGRRKTAPGAPRPSGRPRSPTSGRASHASCTTWWRTRSASSCCRPRAVAGCCPSTRTRRVAPSMRSSCPPSRRSSRCGGCSGCCAVPTTSSRWPRCRASRTCARSRSRSRTPGCRSSCASRGSRSRSRPAWTSPPTGSCRRR